jgi:hypothetical protein
MADAVAEPAAAPLVAPAPAPAAAARSGGGHDGDDAANAAAAAREIKTDDAAAANTTNPDDVVTGAELEALLASLGLPARIMVRASDAPASEANAYYRADALALDKAAGALQLRFCFRGDGAPFWLPAASARLWRGQYPPDKAAWVNLGKVSFEVVFVLFWLCACFFVVRMPCMHVVLMFTHTTSYSTTPYTLNNKTKQTGRVGAQG